MFREVLALLPGLSSWVECCYNTESHLIFGDHSLLSHCGVQQGDRSPWPPVLCSHSSTNRRENQEGSSQSPLQRLVPRWHPKGPRRSSEDHRGRRSPQGFAPKSLQVSTLHPPGDDVGSNLLPHDIPVTSSGFCLLGTPLGSSGFCESTVLGRFAKIPNALGRLGDLEDSQLQSILLRSSLFLPKFNSALRTCPPTVITKATL